MTVLYAGMDTARYPGDEAMYWLRTETNLRWTGYYLAVGGLGLSDKKTWLQQYGKLRAMHWGVAPLYLGKQWDSPKLARLPGRERENGRGDGEEACALASKEGIKPCVLYFDLEGPVIPGKGWHEYFAGWVEKVLDNFYAPGLYCSPIVAPKVLGELKKRVTRGGAEPEVWAAKYPGKSIGKADPDRIIRSYETYPPGGSGYSDASSWQYAGHKTTFWQQTLRSGKKKAIPVTLDFNSSKYGDPGRCGPMVELER